MRIAGETVGRRGLTLLAVSAVAGVALGAHGWSGRHNGLPPPLAGRSASPTASARATATATPASTPAAGTSAAPAPGPKLSSQPYASYAFQVWPGPASAAAQAAEIGLEISVRRQRS